MSNLTYIYQKSEKGVRLLDTLNYTLEEFKNNPKVAIQIGTHSSMIASEVKYEHPCMDQSGET